MEGYYCFGDRSINDGQWHHIVVTLRIINNTGSGGPGSVKTTVVPNFYIDGVEHAAVEQMGISVMYSNWDIQDTNMGDVTKKGSARIAETPTTATSPFKGDIAEAGIWKKKLSSSAAKAIYVATRTKYNSLISGYTPLTDTELKQTKIPYDVQGYQNIAFAPGSSFKESEYHSTVYSKLAAHNNDDIMHALKLLNSSSCEDVTNPLEKRAATGFYFGNAAGSITFGDVYMLGEYE